MDDQLMDYVKEALQRNFSELLIRSRLEEAGFPKNDIDEAFAVTYRELGAVDIHPKLLKCIITMLDHNYKREEIIAKLLPNGFSEQIIDVAIDFAILTERAFNNLR